jgi:hypothetical protein
VIDGTTGRLRWIDKRSQRIGLHALRPDIASPDRRPEPGSNDRSCRAIVRSCDRAIVRSRAAAARTRRAEAHMSLDPREGHAMPSDPAQQLLCSPRWPPTTEATRALCSRAPCSSACPVSSTSRACLLMTAPMSADPPLHLGVAPKLAGQQTVSGRRRRPRRAPNGQALVDAIEAFATDTT